MQLINTKPIVKIILREFLSDLNRFKFQTILVLDYKRWKDYKIFHSSATLIGSDLGIDEPFKSMHESIMTKMKNYVYEDWIVLDVIIKHGIKIFWVLISEEKITWKNELQV